MVSLEAYNEKEWLEEQLDKAISLIERLISIELNVDEVDPRLMSYLQNIFIEATEFLKDVT